ncbi:MAG: N-formylglutamate amidohydrolase [Candidatus Nitrospinota bacterium M3_3B_026]
MTLPLLISVPHAGLSIPAEAQGYASLSPEDIIADGDEGAGEVYDIADEVAAYITTDVARAIVDPNRAEDDRGPDGVVKTHTCWGVPVYGDPPPEDVIETLLARYYRPYHRRLSELAPKARAGVDCHTMAAEGPPVGPDEGAARPLVCISCAEGASCPWEWVKALAESFRDQFGPEVRIDDPFKGGHIIRSHSGELPWVQLEISRGPFMTNDRKRERVLKALRNWVPACGR